MSTERLMTVLLGPHLSEKSQRVADAHNQVVFLVRRDATKSEIRDAVQSMFEVEVDSVTVVNQRGKVKRARFSFGRRKDWKKAYVRLAKGHDIDFVGAD